MSSPNLLTSTKGSDWSATAKNLVERVGNPSTAAIASLLELTNAQRPFSDAIGILDNGCGPGSVMTSLLDAYGAYIPQACSLTCSDFSEGMIEQVNAIKTTQSAAGNGQWSRVQTIVSDATNMSAVSSDSCSHILAGWVYFMTPDPQKCLSESKRILQPHGVLGLSSWEDSEWLQVMRTLTTVYPDRSVPSLPESWSSTAAVKGEMEKAGFSNVKSIPCIVYMGYQSQREIVRFLLSNIPPMVAAMKGLDEEQINHVEKAMIKKCKELSPAEPGRFSGQAIIAVGTKE